MVRNQPGNFDMLPFVPIAIAIAVLFCYGNVQLVTFNCARMRAYARALTKIKTFAEFLPRKRPSAPRARRRCFYTKRSLVLLPRARSITTSIRLIARIYLLIFNFYFFINLFFNFRFFGRNIDRLAVLSTFLSGQRATGLLVGKLVDNHPLSTMSMIQIRPRPIVST